MIPGVRRLTRDNKGGTAVEFALIAPTFLMFLFLILDGGRMIFAKQSLSEVATATARCAAIKLAGCTDTASAQSWAVSRARGLQLTTGNVTVQTGVTCNTVANMAKATISITWDKGAMALLPQSVAPSTLTSIACFPIAT